MAGPATRRWRLPSDTLVMPSITDAHLHLVSLLLARTQLDLTPTPDLDATLRTLADTDARRRAAGDADSWLIGHGWSLHGLGRWPDLAMLERVAPGRPVALYAHDHHTRWVSRRALALARITQETADPAGGSLRRDAGGRLTGILHEAAAGLVDVAIPDPPDEDLERELAAQARRAFRLGHHRLPRSGRAVQCDRASRRGPLFYRRLAERGRLPLRVHSSIRRPSWTTPWSWGCAAGRAIGRYRMGWLKLFADGSLGSRSAALLEPYSDAARTAADRRPARHVPRLGAKSSRAHLTRAAAAWHQWPGARHR